MSCSSAYVLLLFGGPQTILICKIFCSLESIFAALGTVLLLSRRYMLGGLNDL